jgi:hypothetical protein
MKPTEKHIKIIEVCETILKYWKTTNDIKSPSHSNIIIETLTESELDVLLTVEEINDLFDNLWGLLCSIKQK